MFSVSFCLVILMSGVCLLCIRIFSNGGCWVRGNFFGGPGHVYISCLYLFAVRLAGRYNFIWSQLWIGRRDCTDFAFLWLYSGGYCTGEMVRGGDPIFLLFLQFAVSSPGGWILVGILCYIFCWKICSVILRFLIL